MSDETQGSVAAAPAAPSGDAPAPGSGASAAPTVDWTAHIPKELSGAKTFEPYKGKPLGEVLKSLHDAQSYAIGAIKLPSDKDRPEDREKKLADIYTKLGRPADPAGYKHQLPELPGGRQWQEEHVGQFNTVAHQLGLNQAQAQGLLNFYGELVGKSVPNERELLQTAEQELKDAWGVHYDRNVALADRGYKKLLELTFSDEEREQAARLDQEMLQSQFLKNPRMAKVMATIGKMFTEDKLITGEDAPNDNEALEAKIREEMNKPEYMNGDHPLHKDAVNKVYKLRKELNNPVRTREKVFA